MVLLKSLFAIQLALCSLSLAQTPPDSQPATTSNLPVAYGTKKVTPGLKLAQSDVQSIPTFTFNGTAQQNYTLLLLDLSISTARLNTSTLAPAQLPLAPGLGQNRTTRLHFWQAGLTFAANGTLSNRTQPVAYYAPPSPPAGDIAHAYVFYLFRQDAGFQGPAANSPFNPANVNANSSNRQSFNVQTFAKSQGVGPLVGANYILVQNNQTTSASSGVASATASRTSSSSSRATTSASRTGSGSPASFTGAAAKLPSGETIGSVMVSAAAALLMGA